MSNMNKNTSRLVLGPRSGQGSCRCHKYGSFGLMALVLSTFAILFQQVQRVSLLNCQRDHSASDIDRKVEPSVLSTFDKMHNKFHKTAATLTQVERKKYEVGKSIMRGTGGLSDTDRMLLAEIYSSANSVFEFGLGESTKIAAWVGVPRYVGVDSDATWVTNVRRDINMDHFRFVFADIGPTREMGNPLIETLQKIPLSYQTAPLNDEMEAFDFYLVDGRYRVACACASMLHAMSRGGNMTKVMFGIHDWPSREYYHVVLSIADMVKEAESLKVFRLKSNATEHDIEQLWIKNAWSKE